MVLLSRPCRGARCFDCHGEHDISPRQGTGLALGPARGRHLFSLTHHSARVSDVVDAGKDGPKAIPAVSIERDSQTCLRAPTPQTGFGLPTTATGARWRPLALRSNRRLRPCPSSESFRRRRLRAHSLHYDSTLLPLYRKLGLEYDCYYMPIGRRPTSILEAS